MQLQPMYKKYKGYSLIATILILGMILTVAVSLAFAAVMNRRASIGSSKSGVSYQKADEGVEKVMYDILGGTYETVDELPNCNAASGLIETSEYKVELRDELDETIDCDGSTAVSEVRKLKSVGIEANQTQRAVEAPVFCGGVREPLTELVLTSSGEKGYITDMIYDEENSRYYAVGYSFTGELNTGTTSYEFYAAFWYSSEVDNLEDLASATWTKGVINQNEANNQNQEATGIVYDSENERYYVSGFVNKQSDSNYTGYANEAVIFYSSSNDLTSASWTTKVVYAQNESDFYANDIIYDENEDRYCVAALGAEESSGGHFGSTIHCSDSRDLTTASWSIKVVDSNGAGILGIMYDYENNTYYAFGVAGDSDAYIYKSDSLDEENWDKRVLAEGTGSQKAIQAVFSSSLGAYYISGGDNGDFGVWKSSSDNLDEAEFARRNFENSNGSSNYLLKYDSLIERYVLGGQNLDERPTIWISPCK